MTSIITNTAAISTIAHLRDINDGLLSSQTRASSGYRVGTSADNAAYWSIATTMRSDNRSLSAVEDALGLGAAMVDTATTGFKSAIDVMDDIKSRLVAGREPGVDRNKINAEITELKAQLGTIADAASFNGENWLKHRDTDQPWLKQPIQIVASVSRNSNVFAVETLHYERQASTFADKQIINALVDDSAQTHGEYGILTSEAYAVDLGLTTGYVMVQGSGTNSVPNGAPVLPRVEISISSATTDQEIEDMISVTDAMLMDMTTTATVLGTAGARIGRQENFVADLRDTIDRGVGRLVDADMTQESAKLKALTTQQSLGTSALSIANQHASNIMTLYQN
ncbi:MAG: flagellin [Rhizobium sp.]|nr:flagellin [Rhizobium sp.]